MMLTSHLGLGCTDLPTFPCVELMDCLLLIHSMSLKVTWLDAPESVIHMSLLLSMVILDFVGVALSPYS